MYKSQFLNNNMMTSLIENQSVVRPKGSSLKKTLAVTLILTSLVDAFSILVIYLLLNTSNNPETLDIKGMELPMASQSVVLKTATTVRLEGSKIYIDENEVNSRSLTEEFEKVATHLEESEKLKPLLIQADKNLKYTVLNPIILAATQAGFNKFKFAVVQGGEEL